MKTEDLAFLNEQLSGLLSTGIPLSAGIKKIAQTTRKSDFKKELTLLEQDLANGVDFPNAINKRNFPTFYKKILIVGATTNKLPELLNSAADYYRKKSEITMKIKGLMIYPTIVLFTAFIVSMFLKFVIEPQFKDFMLNFKQEGLIIGPHSQSVPIFIILIFLIFLTLRFIKPINNYFMWRCSPFKDFNLANLSSMLSVCISTGMTLEDSLEIVANFESGKIRKNLNIIKQSLQAGKSIEESFSSVRIFPNLFQWMIISSGSQLADGLKSISEMYEKRGSYKSETILYSILPVSIMVLGLCITWQFAAFFRVLFQIIEKIGG